MAEAKPKQAQDKLAFLLSLVPYLMDHDGVSVTEAAAQFGVPAQQVRDAVRLIGVSGIPGETRTYQHGDLFDIAWDDFEENDRIVLTNMVAIDDSPRFSAREAAALIAGLQYLSALPENADRAALASLMSKLSRGASGRTGQVSVAGAETDAVLAVVRDAIARGVQLRFRYVDAQGVTADRTIDPLRVESVDADWYVRGWDHLRQALRTFRLDRVLDPQGSEQAISAESRAVPLPDRLFEGSPDDLEVVLEVAESAAPLLDDYLPQRLGAGDAPGTVRMSLRVSHHHGLKRLVAGMPGAARVVAPADAVAAVAEWAAAGAARYR